MNYFRAKEADLKIIVLDCTKEELTLDRDAYKLIFNKFKDLIIGKSDENQAPDKKQIDVKDSNSSITENLDVNWTNTDTIVVFNKIDLARNSHISELKNMILKREENLDKNNVTEISNIWNVNFSSNAESHDTLYGSHDGQDLLSHVNYVKSRRNECERIEVGNLTFDTAHESGISTPVLDNQSLGYSSVVSLRREHGHIPCCFISCVDGDGMDTFLEILQSKIADL